MKKQPSRGRVVALVLAATWVLAAPGCAPRRGVREIHATNHYGHHYTGMHVSTHAHYR